MDHITEIVIVKPIVQPAPNGVQPITSLESRKNGVVERFFGDRLWGIWGNWEARKAGVPIIEMFPKELKLKQNEFEWKPFGHYNFLWPHVNGIALEYDEIDGCMGL